MGAGATTNNLYVNQPVVNDELFRETEKRCKSGFYINNPDKYKQTIEESIKNTRLDLLEILIPAGKCKDALPVHIACSCAKLESLELLISAGFPVTTTDEDGRTPLHHCSHTHNSDAALCATALMLTSKKIVRIKDFCGDSALHYAVQERNKFVVNAICDEAEFGESAQQPDKLTKSSYFAVAPVLDAKDKKGNTALSLAKKLRYADMVEVFTAREAAANEAKEDLKKKAEVSMERIMKIWEQFFTNAMTHMGEEMAEEDEVGGFMYGELGRSASGTSTASGASAAVAGWRQYSPADPNDIFGQICQQHQQVRGNRTQSQQKSHTLSSSSSKMNKGGIQSKGQYTDMKPRGPSRAQSMKADFSYQNPSSNSDGRFSSGVAAVGDSPSEQALSEWLGHWLLVFSDYEQRYYMVDTSDCQAFASLWVEDFLELMRTSRLHRLFGSLEEDEAETAGAAAEAKSGGAESSRADNLPCSFAEAYRRYWLTYYDLEYNSCYWMQLTTGRCEYYLPIAEPLPERFVPEPEPEPEPEGAVEKVYDPCAGKYVPRKAKRNRPKRSAPTAAAAAATARPAVDPSLVWDGWVAAHQVHVTYAWALVISSVDGPRPTTPGEDKDTGEKEGGIPDIGAKVSGWDEWGSQQQPDEAPALPPVYKYLNTVTNQLALEPPLHWVDVVYGYNGTTEADAVSDGVAVWYYCCSEDLVPQNGVDAEERQLSHFYWWNIETNETVWA